MEAASGKAVWIGRVITALVSIMFGFSAVMKFVGGEALAKGFEHLGLPESLALPVGILEITCLAIYLIPATSVLGAILLTGYLGGAICTHLRVADPLVAPIILGVAVWLGLYLREYRLKALLPLRRS